MSKIMYPGSFDPITKGHMNVIEQTLALNAFDEILVAILINPTKKEPLFTIQERVDMIKEIYKNNDKIKVVSSDKSAVDVALLYECSAILRGVRGVNDFNEEILLATINKEISNNKVNTIFISADKEYQFVSSSVVKEIFNLNKSINNYVDPIVEKRMLVKRRRN